MMLKRYWSPWPKWKPNRGHRARCASKMNTSCYTPPRMKRKARLWLSVWDWRSPFRRYCPLPMKPQSNLCLRVLSRDSDWRTRVASLSLSSSNSQNSLGFGFACSVENWVNLVSIQISSRSASWAVEQLPLFMRSWGCRTGRDWRPRFSASSYCVRIPKNSTVSRIS